MRIVTTHLIDIVHEGTEGGDKDRSLKALVDTVAGPPTMGTNWPSDWDNGM